MGGEPDYGNFAATLAFSEPLAALGGSHRDGRPMARDDRYLRVDSGRHPVLWLLASFPIAYFTGALLTDLAYLKTALQMWADFSAWLLAFGMIMGGIAAVCGIVVQISSRTALWPGWPFALGCAVTLALGLVNNFVHSRDAWTSVVPTGLVLSAVTVLVMLATVLVGAIDGQRRVRPVHAEARI